MLWNYEAAYRLLRKDPLMEAIIKATGKMEPLGEKDLYISLLNSVVSQQLSVKAAATIWSRFIQLFEDGRPDADMLVRTNDEVLRKCGLSYSKAGYMRNIAAFYLEGNLEYLKLRHFTDEDLIHHLSTIKGVGRWTAEMILIFNLHRPDVMPYDDLGIQISIRDLYGLSMEKSILKKEIEILDLQWRPYRSLACRHLWKIRDQSG